MEWVAIDVHIAGDAVTHRLADLFKLRVAEAAGLLTLAFAGMAQHAQDGSLTDVTDSQIEAWCFWHGKRGAFAAFFRAQLCDDTGTVRAWDTYNGAHIREANAARERMQAYRAKKKAERSQNGTANGTANDSGNGTQNVPDNRTGQDRTKKKSKSISPAAGAPRPTWLSPYAEAWAARFGGQPAFGELAKHLKPVEDAHGPAETLRRWKIYLAASKADHANPSRFATTFGAWSGEPAPGSEAPRVPRATELIFT